MGGSFNPIHNGHIAIARAAYEQYDIDKILFMPSFNPSSYKDISDLVNPTHRCEMVKLAIKDYSYMELSTIEIERQGKTYTADTLKQLDGVYDYIYFIIGADSLLALDKWYKAEYVLKNCHFLAADRDKHPSDELKNKAEYLCSKYNARIDFISVEKIPISSSDIRKRAKNNESIDGLLPASVGEYIKHNHLYYEE